MKLTFKDLKQRKIEIEVEPSETISAVKEKLQQKEGWEPSTQKLIYSGKILQDEKTVESYKIDEKGWVVCMISKPKAAPKPAAAAEPSTPAKPASTPAAPAAPAASGNTGSAAAVPQTPTPTAPSTTAANDPQSFNDPSALAMGEQRAAAIASMEGMGFPRDQIDRAMRAAFFNPDRAVEYLLSGIPETAQEEQRAAPPAAAAPAAGGQSQQTQQPAGGNTTGAATVDAADDASENVNLFDQAMRAGQQGNTRGQQQGGGGAGAAAGGAAAAGGNTSDLDFLRNVPQFQQLRQVVQQQPQMLEPILQQLAAGNPQLAQIINQNPEQFMQLLAEDGDDDVALPPGVQQISVTEEESQAIERLCNLGFPRDDVIQAYFACDKNEELAANFLFEQPYEEDPGNNQS